MSAGKYAMISAAIEQRIRAGVYARRLPTTLALAAEFGVARQTLTNALRPLTEKGLLTAAGKHGMLVNAAAERDGGIIALVSGNTAESLGRDDTLNEVIASIEAAGFVPLRLGLPNKYKLRNPARIFKADFAGVLFFSSSLTLEIALYLESRGIPFVSCNRLPVYSRLNFVEFDWMAALENLVGIAVARGYRRIALFFCSRLEGYGQVIEHEWARIKEKFALPPVPQDRIRYTDDSGPIACCGEFVDTLLRNELPELVILWGSYMGENADDYREVRRLCTMGIPVLGVSVPGGAESLIPEQVIRFEACHLPGLMSAAFDALRELIIAAPLKPIHRFVQYKINLWDELPRCPTSKTG